jgi:hypothetical protein
MDTIERARRLLEKGSAILAQDLERAVEVSYYIQQVRAILQRAEQRGYWSNVYRKRLALYLLAWLSLSLVIVTACALYTPQLRSNVAGFSGLALDGLAMQNFIAFCITISAGMLGSALGALINMWRHGKKEYGFFDRKYGLLGIVLPIIGIIVGAILYLAAGALSWIFRLNPATNLLFSVLPAILAFAFGCSQEKIYGTSE